jgi:hypothetical protein
MAKKRNHPHADAIHTAGWMSLFTLHASGRFCGFGPRCTGRSRLGHAEPYHKA